MSFLDKMKKAGKSVVDAGAKQMLKVRMKNGRVYLCESSSSLGGQAGGCGPLRSGHSSFYFYVWLWVYVSLFGMCLFRLVYSAALVLTRLYS